ncbi:10456_t:CDS:1, partial [Ambispora gerdemannii]
LQIDYRLHDSQHVYHDHDIYSHVINVNEYQETGIWPGYDYICEEDSENSNGSNYSNGSNDDSDESVSSSDDQVSDKITAKKLLTKLLTK